MSGNFRIRGGSTVFFFLTKSLVFVVNYLDNGIR